MARLGVASLLVLALVHAVAVQGGDVVLLGMSNRQCNAVGNLNLDGTVLLSGDKNLLDSPAACCASCKLRADCNIWSYCSTPGGCDAGGGYRECALKQDWNVWKYQRVISRGTGWVSGYIGSRCPGSDPTKLLALQRVNFPALSSLCQLGSSCTSCTCQLSKAMTVAKGDPADLSSCVQNFRTVMMFPAELGGSSLSAAAYQRLLQCPIADPPCADQKSATVFATLGPAVVPTSLGSDVTSCWSGKSERDCASSCLSTSGCDGFLYNTAGSGRCCLKSGASRSWQLSANGDSFYFRMPAGTTAEDSFFMQPNPWGLNSGPQDKNSSSSTATSTSTTATTTTTTTTSMSCAQSACTDTPPDNRFTCRQQRDFGKCAESWMQGYCQQTCGRCPCATTGANSASTSASPSSTSSSPAATTTTISQACTCTDVMPNVYPCGDEARWKKCGYGYMQAKSDLPEGYCQISCGRCNCPVIKQCNCDDLQPSAGTTCKQHAAWGSCSQEWMWRSLPDRPRGYCQTTCGRCKC